MIETTIKFYLPDVIKLGKYKEMTEYLNSIHSTKIYFWYNEDDLKQSDVDKFLKEWQSIEHTGLKTIIRPYFFDLHRDFVKWDFIPNDQKEKYNGKLDCCWRYQWGYNSPEAILDGLQEAKVMWEFVNKEDLPKKQKRNDGEDSNHR